MGIHKVKVRARVALGNVVAVTPSGSMETKNIIMSFNVTKTRGQISTFSASLKVMKGEVTGNILGSTVEIKAGENSPSNTIFTGICRSATINPCREDPIYVILNISGNDVLSRLEGKKYTRRCRSTRGSWVSINAVTRPGLRSKKLTYTPKDPTIEAYGGDVQRKSNVTSTRALNTPKTDRIKDQTQNLTITPEIEFVAKQEQSGG